MWEKNPRKVTNLRISIDSQYAKNIPYISAKQDSVAGTWKWRLAGHVIGVYAGSYRDPSLKQAQADGEAAAKL